MFSFIMLIVAEGISMEVGVMPLLLVAIRKTTVESCDVCTFLVVAFKSGCL